MKRIHVALLVLLVLGGAWVYYTWGPRESPAGQPPLAWLDEPGVARFKEQFNAAGGGHRILILLSPT